MKKPLVTLCVLIIMSSSTLAQFSIGPRFGINLASVSNDPDYGSGVEQSSMLGFIFGASVELGIAGPFYIEVQPLYIQKGEDLKAQVAWNTQQGQQQLDTDVSDRATYLEFPVLFKIKIPAGPIKPYGFVGPNIGINLSGTRTFKSSAGEEEQDLNASSIDFALDFGAGVSFGVMPMMSLTFDVRYSLGLSNVLDVETPQGGTAPSANTRGIQLMIGAMFGL
ncbi:MAG: PorT family protein [Ignavibacteriales bacterium]|nr:MAG: PorT family protein [Ignavibacteriales bacterium]